MMISLEFYLVLDLMSNHRTEKSAEKNKLNRVVRQRVSKIVNCEKNKKANLKVMTSPGN